MAKENLSELENLLNKMIENASSRRIFLQVAPLMMAACAAPEKTRYREGDNAGQETELTVADEKRLTSEVLPKMQKEYPPLKDSVAQDYIRSLGQKIVYANDLNRKPYTYNFTLVDSEMVNAFALPAGTIFVTKPLLLMAETEAELAGVIGHEIGHVVARHTAERMDKAKRSQKQSLLYTLGGGLLGGALGYGASKLICDKRDKECIKRATELGVMGGAAGGLLIQKYAFMANSREDEMEADRVGFRTAYKANYSSRFIGNFYTRLLAMEEKAKSSRSRVELAIADAMSTHPPSRERVVQMRQMQQEVKNRKNALVSSTEFERLQKRLKS